MAAMTKADFVEAVLSNHINREILARLPQLAVPQGYLVAGCLFQSVWNAHDGHAVGAHVKDYDVFYFDDSDLSWEAEDVVIRRTAILFTDLDVDVEVRNQARVHLWFQQKIGVPCPQLPSAHHGIDRFLVAGTCVAMRPDNISVMKFMQPMVWMTGRQGSCGSTRCMVMMLCLSKRPAIIRHAGLGLRLRAAIDTQLQP
jgi:hypothetical protein